MEVEGNKVLKSGLSYFYSSAMIVELTVFSTGVGLTVVDCFALCY